MEKKSERFEMVYTPSEKEALQELAYNQGISMANFIRNYIRRSAKRQKIWNGA